MKRRTTMLKKLPIASAIALALASTASVQAAEIEVGDFLIKFDAIISDGAAWRMEDQDLRFIHPGNMAGGTGQSGVADYGSLNYDKGDMVSSVIKGVHDLSIGGANIGAFVRFKYWHDYVIKNKEVAHGHTATNYFLDMTLYTDGLDSWSCGSLLKLLEPFVYGYFDIG